MERVNRIIHHPLFVQEYARLRKMEQGRVYCGHTMEHFLDVARVGWILALEQKLPIEKDIVYAAGLLHDIGKGMQYEFGTPHQEASADLAERIMPECGYTPAETAQVAFAIRLHRKAAESDAPLVSILYEADKKTRLCFCCSASDDCNWSYEKKNHRIIY